MNTPFATLSIRLSVKTEDGEFVAAYSGRGLAALDFPVPPRPSPPRPNPTSVPRRVQAWHRLTEAAVRRILAGQPPPRALPPLDLEAGTAFQRTVWEALRAIPAGDTVTYTAIARRIGRPRAVRAVGQACGANPVPLLVPCHRVVAAGGGLGGFSGGLHWKRLLLAREGAAPKPRA